MRRTRRPWASGRPGRSGPPATALPNRGRPPRARPWSPRTRRGAARAQGSPGRRGRRPRPAAVHRSASGRAGQPHVRFSSWSSNQPGLRTSWKVPAGEPIFIGLSQTGRSVAFMDLWLIGTVRAPGTPSAWRRGTAARPAPNGDVAIVAHGGTLRMLNAYLRRIPVERMRWEPLANGCILRAPAGRSTSPTHQKGKTDESDHPEIRPHCTCRAGPKSLATPDSPWSSTARYRCGISPT